VKHIFRVAKLLATSRCSGRHSRRTVSRTHVCTTTFAGCPHCHAVDGAQGTCSSGKVSCALTSPPPAIPLVFLIPLLAFRVPRTRTRSWVGAVEVSTHSQPLQPLWLQRHITLLLWDSSPRPPEQPAAPPSTPQQTPSGPTAISPSASADRPSVAVAASANNTACTSPAGAHEGVRAWM